jgi:hypothetical protein
VIEAAATRRHRFVVAISLVLLAASCGGGGTEEATPSPCATVAPGPDGSPTPTPIPCPADAGGAPSAEPTGELVGESWEGTATIASSAVYPEGSATCEDGWELEFTFGATAEGTIDGQGTGELTTPPTCSFPINDVPTVAHVEYQVLGEETAGGFSLRFALATSGFPNAGATLAGFFSIFSVPASPSGGPPVSVAVSGTSGTGQGAWQYESGNPPATYSANGTIRIECVTCEGA